jgi:hypothetical protein
MPFSLHWRRSARPQRRRSARLKRRGTGHPERGGDGDGDEGADEDGGGGEHKDDEESEKESDDDDDEEEFDSDDDDEQERRRILPTIGRDAEDVRLVVHLGYGYTKFGLAGEAAPTCLTNTIREGKNYKVLPLRLHPARSDANGSDVAAHAQI